MLVQHRFGDTGGVGDVVHRRAVEAGPAEHLERDVEDLFPARGRGQTGVGGAGSGHVLPEGNRVSAVLEIVSFGGLDRVAEDDRGHQEHERHDHRRDDQGLPSSTRTPSRTRSRTGRSPARARDSRPGWRAASTCAICARRARTGSIWGWFIRMSEARREEAVDVLVEEVEGDQERDDAGGDADRACCGTAGSARGRRPRWLRPPTPRARPGESPSGRGTSRRRTHRPTAAVIVGAVVVGGDAIVVGDVVSTRRRVGVLGGGRSSPSARSSWWRCVVVVGAAPSA